MKRAVILLPALLLALAPVAAQDYEKKGGGCCEGGEGKPWKPYNKFVKWEESPEVAYKKSEKDLKLVLLFDLVGNLDKEGC